MTFGEKVRKRRKELKMTQKELADKLGYDTSSVARIESDERRPVQYKIIEIAEVLDLSPSYLMGYTSSDSESHIGHALYEALGELSDEEIAAIVSYSKDQGFGSRETN